jgi:hypothetical protein
MGRPVKDYWNWPKVSIKNIPGEWKKHTEIDQYLYRNLGDSGYHITVDREWPVPRTRYDFKQVTCYYYYVKDPQHATMIQLKWA